MSQNTDEELLAEITKLRNEIKEKNIEITNLKTTVENQELQINT